MGEIDPAFIQEQEHRPKLSLIEAEGIPLIDLSSLTNHNDRSFENLVRKIGDSCSTWFFFQIINHGVPLEKRERLEQAAREFFLQPAEEKRKARRDEVNPHGYYAEEFTKNVRDWKEVLDIGVKDPMIMPMSHEVDYVAVKEVVNQWPDYPPELREVFQDYAKELEKLSHKLLELISLSLGINANRLCNFFNNHTSFIRFNHYPPCPEPHLALGVGRHKDSGALTVLAQDGVGGLEVKRKSDGEWVRVEPIPNAYIVNVGDIIQVWSNEIYKSVEHRVMVNSSRERFSIPFFFNPDHETMVEPLEELTSKQNPAKYRAYNWGKYISARKLSNFKKLNVDNLQISDFKIA